MLQEIQKLCTALESATRSTGELKESITIYIDTVDMLSEVMFWNEYADTTQDEILGDCDSETTQHLKELSEQLSTEYKDRMEKSFESFDYVLDDPANLPDIIQERGARIEQVCGHTMRSAIY